MPEVSVQKFLFGVSSNMKKFTLLCAAAAIVAPSAAFAQETTSSIRGQVTSGGAAVPNAVVVITHDPSGTTSTVESIASFDSSGVEILRSAFCSDWRVSRIIAWLAIISLTVSPAPGQRWHRGG